MDMALTLILKIREISMGKEKVKDTSIGENNTNKEQRKDPKPPGVRLGPVFFPSFPRTSGRP